MFVHIKGKILSMEIMN